MTIQRAPFTTTRTEEERAQDKTETISLKLNQEEREQLEELKELLDIGPDAPSIKMLMGIGRRVLLSHFSVSDLQYLVSLKRVRYDARKRKAKGRNAPKVLPESGQE